MSHAPGLIAVKRRKKTIPSNRTQSLEAHCYKFVELCLVTKLTTELRCPNDDKSISQDR